MASQVSAHGRSAFVLSQNDLRERQIASTVACALWLAFLGTVARGLFHDYDLLRHIIGRPMIDAAAGVLIIQGLLTFREWRRAISDRTVYILTSLVLMTATFAILHGLLSAPAFARWFQQGVLPFGTAVGVFLACRPLVFERIYRALLNQLYIGVIFAGYVLLHWTPQVRLDWWWTEQTNEGLGPIAARCLFALPFLVAGYQRLRWWELLLVGIGYVEFIVLNLIGINRAAIVIALLVTPVLLILTALRQGRSVRLLAKISLAVTIVVFLLIEGAKHLPSSDTSIRTDFQRMMVRFDVDDVYSATPTDIVTGITRTLAKDFAGSGKRSSELHDLLAETSFSQYLVGRGFGVSWYCQTYAVLSPQWYVVHIGPGYMLMVGGLPLAIFYTALLGAALWRSWKYTPTSAPACSALLFLAAASVNYLQHGFLLDEPEFYLFWLCIGLSVMQQRHMAAIPVRLEGAASAGTVAVLRPRLRTRSA